MVSTCILSGRLPPLWLFILLATVLFELAVIKTNGFPLSRCPKRDRSMVSEDWIKSRRRRSPALALSCARGTTGTRSTPFNDSNNSNESNNDHKNNNDWDDKRRRQLLVSLLLTTAATTGVSPVVHAYVNNANTTTKEEATTSIHDAFRGIVAPPLDQNDYLSFTLDNGLRVLIASDPKTSSNEAGVCMDVHVGACSDSIPGLAHFHEHMLFLGTQDYPVESSFEQFLSVNGGVSNAYTADTDTVYYYTVNADAESTLKESLLRFASFFANPLFTESATLRELNAIESEHAKNLQSDTFRNYQLFKSRANSNHPFSKFFTGNKETLAVNTKASNIDLRQSLLQFYQTYYSANQMTLAIVAPQPLEQLQQLVVECFAKLPNRSIPKPETKWIGVPVFLNDQSLLPSFGYKVEVVPVSDLRQAIIAFPVLYGSDLERQLNSLIHPSSYVAHLIGHEGPNSLLSALKSKGWVNGLGVALAEESSDFECLEITVGLTLPGLVEVDAVLRYLFSYLRLLTTKSIPDYVYKEVLQLEELQWRFLTKGSRGSYATSLSTAMQKYPPALYIAGPRRLSLDEVEADPQLSGNARTSFPSRIQFERTRDRVQKYIDELTVDNAIITVLSKSFEGQTDRKEKWYGTNYRVRAIPESTLDAWKNCERPQKLKLDYPKPNIFIPSETGLRVKYERQQDTKRQSFEERMQPLEPPRIIRDDGPNGQWTVYFKEDRRFGKPQGYLVFQVLTKQVYLSPVSAALGDMYQICVSDKLQEYAYDAELAGLTYEVRVLPRGVRLTFGGYNDKLKKFASFVSRKLSTDVKDLLPRDDNDFDRYKDQIMRALSAFDVQQPYSHASYYSQLTLQPRRFKYTNQELRDATRKITLPDLVSYVSSLWKSGKGEALIQGNYDEAEALDLVRSIGDVLPFKPIPNVEIPPKLEALPLPASKALTVPPRLLVEEPNLSNENSVSYVMLQSLGESDKDHVLLEMINAIVEEPFYNELRTKKQLGYIVASGVKAIADTRTLSFIVQSSIAPPDSLTIEILGFLDLIERNILEKVSRADLAVYVKSLIEKKTEPDKELAAEVQRNWAEISSERLQFDRLQREAAALLDIEKEDVINFWKRLYSTNGRRVLITEMVPRQGAASTDVPPVMTGYGTKGFPEESYVLGIDDIEEFRRVRERDVYKDNVFGEFPDYTKATFETAKVWPAVPVPVV